MCDSRLHRFLRASPCRLSVFGYVRLTLGRLGKGVVDGGQELFVVEWLDEKGRGTDGHGGGASGGVVARSNGETLGPRGEGGHSRQDFQAGDSFHPDVGYHDRDRVGGRVSEEFSGLLESADRHTVRREQIFHRPKHGEIVIHEADFGRSVHAASLFESPRIAGRWKEKQAPRSGAFSAVILPPWVSTMERTMVNPIPMPVSFVEKKWSKTFPGRSCGKLAPKSRTVTSAASPLSDRVVTMMRRWVGGSPSTASSAFIDRKSVV